jgi:hypothetical protein
MTTLLSASATILLSLLAMIVAGIGLAQGISPPLAALARWRRRGAALAAGAAGLALALAATRPGTIGPADAAAMALLCLLVLAQWWSACRGWWDTQRWLAVMAYLAFIVPVAGLVLVAMTTYPGRHTGIGLVALAVGAAGAALASGLLGGLCAAGLLVSCAGTGPAAQALRRLLRLILLLLLLRLALSATMGFWPWWDRWGIDSHAPYGSGPKRDWWTALMLLGRYGIGGLLPLATLRLALTRGGPGTSGVSGPPGPPGPPGLRRGMPALVWLTGAAAAAGEGFALVLAAGTARPF